MDYKTTRDRTEEMIKNHYKDFVKALISFEKGIKDENDLDKIYDEYMESNTASLLNEDFDYMIDNLQEQGIINNSNIKKEDEKKIVKHFNDCFEIAVQQSKDDWAEDEEFIVDEGISFLNNSKTREILQNHYGKKTLETMEEIILDANECHKERNEDLQEETEHQSYVL